MFLVQILYYFAIIIHNNTQGHMELHWGLKVNNTAVVVLEMSGSICLHCKEINKQPSPCLLVSQMVNTALMLLSATC